MAWIRHWMLVGCVAGAATACGKPAGSAEDGSSSGETTAGPGGTATSTTGGETTSATCGDDGTGDPPVEETHVVLLEDCGLELSCDPIGIVTGYSVPECARQLWAAGQPGVLRADYILDGGPIYPTVFQEAFLVMNDRRVIRQGRGRQGTGGGICDDRPWGAWGPHQVCDVVNYFDPEGNVVDCQEVPDYSCEELVDLYNAEPLPPVPCETRDEASCDGPLDADTNCYWSPDYATYPVDACVPIGEVGRCLEHPPYPPPECDPNPVCATVEADNVLFRDNGDGTVDIMTGYGCWLQDGFDRCAWGTPGSNDPPGPLQYGPAACDCAC